MSVGCRMTLASRPLPSRTVLPGCLGWGVAVLVLLATLRSGAAALEWRQQPGWREAALAVPATGRPGFTLLAPEDTGIWFTNQLTYERGEANQNLLNGCGVAAGDYDGDGWVDLFFGSCEGPCGLFRNLGGGRFANRTAEAGVEATNQSTKGVVFADVDGDGRLDLFCASLGGPNTLFLNQGGGRFTNATAGAGLSARAGAHSAALADVDGDGDLDLYVANYGENSILRSGGQVSIRMENGRPVVSGRQARRLKLIDGAFVEYGEPDVLYLNEGGARFRAAGWTDGRFQGADGQPLRADPYDMGLSVLFRDINGDTHPDLYLCNDFQTPDRIWINDGRGNFRALPDLALRVTPQFSMGVDFADIDRDGRDDFFVGDMVSRFHRLRLTQLGATNPLASHVGERLDRVQERRNVLAWNRGDGTYADIAWFAGVAASDWTWSVAFLDVDLDGYEDLLTVNGHAYDTQDLDMMERTPEAKGTGMNRQIGKSLRSFPPLSTPNWAFRNRRDRTFAEAGRDWGFHSTNISHGIALADLDNDGDQDVVVSCLWRPPLVYRNDSTAPRVAVRLRGAGANTRGIGARVTLRGGAVPEQSQEIHAGGRYLSADDALRVFAAGAATGGMTLEVTWRSGRRSVVRDVRPNHLYEVEEGAAVPAPAPAGPGAAPAPLFTDASAALGHVHERTPFNDLERQPLLIRMTSQLGPPVGWVDLDGDGLEELVVGASAGGRLGVYRGDGQGGWVRRPGPAGETPRAADVAALAAGPGGLWLSLSGFRTGQPGSLEWLGGPGQPPTGALPTLESGLGPLACADLDGDGDLEIFVGGRVVPGRYPEPATSVLLRWEGGRWQVAAGWSRALQRVGLVSGAVFSDLDGDGAPELVLACEWGGIRLFRREGEELREVTAAWGLDGWAGWWTGVTAGDFDGDGRMDLLAGNWGLNHAAADPGRGGAWLAGGDVDGNGTWDLVEAERDAESGRVRPSRDLNFLSQGMPGLRVKFPRHAAFATADLEAVAPGVAVWQASNMVSVVFLNRGGRFAARALPAEAQWSPVMGATVADWDGDGSEDVFLAQNFFAQRPEEPRQDAGRGLWLRGRGTGDFVAVPGQESGVRIHGEQRGAAAADYDGDGRMDLVVAQAGGATQLYRNAGGRPGLRVRLRGPAGNPAAVGAVVRLQFGESSGPAREVRAGSGFGSQDGLVPVLAAPRPPTAIWVRWPGGAVTTTPLTGQPREVTLEAGGRLTGSR
ncbi:MAG: hypothetical protein RJA22_1157 [Verrucomicrobiota bacterium]